MDPGILFDEVWKKETIDLSKIYTVRDGDPLNPNLLQVRNYIDALTEDFNAGQKTTKLTRFQWCKDDAGSDFDPSDDRIKNSNYFIFGYRFGNPEAAHKVCVICHVDTVPASTDSELWDPFNPVVQDDLDYPNGHYKKQPFLMGRGCIDDKGPGVSSFIVARCLARKYDGSAYFDKVQVEVIFDGSEETDMSTPQYLEEVEEPNFGIVFDAFWNVSAEKGGERPVFRVAATAPNSGDLYASSLISSPENSSNTIPDWAEATIEGDEAALEAYATSVMAAYDAAVFDDPDYRKARMTVTSEPDRVVLRAVVLGAQHGSAPQENREDGANPLVSLANFIAGQVKDGTLTANATSTMSKFMTWTWGTRVFGEAHESLYKFDQFFEEGNGTTYALTKTTMFDDDIQLEIDIRYAMDHHAKEWTGEEGFLPGDESTFSTDFQNLVDRFNEENSSLPPVTVTTQTIFAPDIRLPDSNPYFQKSERAFMEVVGEAPPRFAIGGGTDAKGRTSLLAHGPLFNPAMGPPINYHGIQERAPVDDMRLSTEVLFRIMELELLEPTKDSEVRKNQIASMKRLHGLFKKGFKIKCQCSG